MPTINLQIDSRKLAAIVDEAVVASTEVVNFHFKALATADLTNPAELEGVVHRFKAQEMNAESRRALHENWMLSRAFQELLRAVRHSLEEAHTYVVLLDGRHKIKSNATIAEFLHPFRRKASCLPFPELLETVNAKLERKIEFSAAYKSLQKARNCLEHRAGIVSRIETYASDKFELRIPRAKMFYLRNGEQIELQTRHQVDPGDERSEVEVFVGFDTRSKSFGLGERISLTIQEFSEVAFACHKLGHELANKLPRPTVPQD